MVLILLQLVVLLLLCSQLFEAPLEFLTLGVLKLQLTLLLLVDLDLVALADAQLGQVEVFVLHL